MALALWFVTGYALGGTMANGQPVHEGAAACPRWMPFGQQLDVAGIGIVTCEDRMAPWLSDRIDVWVPSVAQAYLLTGLHEVQVL